MPEITIQVFLATYSRSFNVSISSESTIHDFKRTISTVCIGSPAASGQRIIYQGRVLADTDIIGDIWKISEGPHTCHLAVHPSAWTGDPPSLATSNHYPHTRVFSAQQDTQYSSSPVISSPSYMVPYSQATHHYIQYMHTNALRILARQPRIAWPAECGDMEAARATARRGIEATHRGWPSFLNADFPPSTSEDDMHGVQYVYTHIHNLPYLSLAQQDGVPTALQSYAIRVLSYTFPLLCVHPPPPSQQHSNPIQVNPPPRILAPFPVQAQAPRAAIPIRPFILPFIMLSIRTAFLVYFFQPTKKPILGLFVFIWLAWEVTNVLREALRDIHQEQLNAPNNNGGLPGLNRPADQANFNFRRNNVMPGDSRETIINHLANFNLAAEAQFVQPNATPNPHSPPPTTFHRAKTFLVLLFLTAYPGLWDRRRAALRVRETAVRNDANAREARAIRQSEREERRQQGLPVEDEPETSPEQPPMPKPYWVAEYIRRVRSGDWVDDT